MRSQNKTKVNLSQSVHMQREASGICATYASEYYKINFFLLNGRTDGVGQLIRTLNGTKTRFEHSSAF